MPLFHVSNLKNPYQAVIRIHGKNNRKGFYNQPAIIAICVTHPFCE